MSECTHTLTLQGRILYHTAQDDSAKVTRRGQLAAVHMLSILAPLSISLAFLAGVHPPAMAARARIVATAPEQATNWDTNVVGKQNFTGV